MKGNKINHAYRFTRRSNAVKIEYFVDILRAIDSCRRKKGLFSKQTLFKFRLFISNWVDDDIVLLCTHKHTHVYNNIAMIFDIIEFRPI